MYLVYLITFNYLFVAIYFFIKHTSEKSWISPCSIPEWGHPFAMPRVNSVLQSSVPKWSKPQLRSQRMRRRTFLKVAGHKRGESTQVERKLLGKSRGKHGELQKHVGNWRKTQSWGETGVMFPAQVIGGRSSRQPKKWWKLTQQHRGIHCIVTQLQCDITSLEYWIQNRSVNVNGPKVDERW